MKLNLDFGKRSNVLGVGLLIIVVITAGIAVWYLNVYRNDANLNSQATVSTAEQTTQTSSVEEANTSYVSPYVGKQFIDLSTRDVFSELMMKLDYTQTCGSHSLTFKYTPSVALESDQVPLLLDGKEIALANLAIFSSNCEYVYFFKANAGSNISNGLNQYSILTKKIKNITWSEKQIPGTEIAGSIYKPRLGYIFPINDDTLLLSFETITTGRDCCTNFSVQYLLDLTNNNLLEVPFKTEVRPLLLDPKHARLISFDYVETSSLPDDIYVKGLKYFDLITQDTSKRYQIDFPKPTKYSMGCDINLPSTTYIDCVDGMYKIIVSSFKDMDANADEMSAPFHKMVDGEDYIGIAQVTGNVSIVDRPCSDEEKSLNNLCVQHYAWFVLSKKPIDSVQTFIESFGEGNAYIRPNGIGLGCYDKTIDSFKHEPWISLARSIVGKPITIEIKKYPIKSMEGSSCSSLFNVEGVIN